jgi:hypothetical protein
MVWVARQSLSKLEDRCSVSTAQRERGVDKSANVCEKWRMSREFSDLEPQAPVIKMQGEDVAKLRKWLSQPESSLLANLLEGMMIQAAWAAGIAKVQSIENAANEDEAVEAAQTALYLSKMTALIANMADPEKEFEFIQAK